MYSSMYQKILNILFTSFHFTYRHWTTAEQCKFKVKMNLNFPLHQKVFSKANIAKSCKVLYSHRSLEITQIKATILYLTTESFSIGLTTIPTKSPTSTEQCWLKATFNVHTFRTCSDILSTPRVKLHKNLSWKSLTLLNKTHSKATTENLLGDKFTNKSTRAEPH